MYKIETGHQLTSQFSKIRLSYTGRPEDVELAVAADQWVIDQYLNRPQGANRNHYVHSEEFYQEFGRCLASGIFPPSGYNGIVPNN